MLKAGDTMSQNMAKKRDDRKTSRSDKFAMHQMLPYKSVSPLPSVSTDHFVGRGADGPLHPLQALLELPERRRLLGADLLRPHVQLVGGAGVTGTGGGRLTAGAARQLRQLLLQLTAQRQREGEMGSGRV